jgi:hypothetical protein
VIAGPTPDSRRPNVIGGPGTDFIAARIERMVLSPRAASISLFGGAPGHSRTRPSHSFDHLVGAGEDQGRDRQAERP